MLFPYKWLKAKRTREAGKWMLFLAMLVILITSVQLDAGDYKCSGSANTDLENIKRARAMHPGRFFRLDQNTLKFEGHIDKGTYANYLKAIDDQVKILVLNSSGGSSYDGVLIGLDLAKRSIDVIVDGAAGSSAANYLFIAGKRKTICRGFVGFHGNAGAVTDRKTFDESIRKAAAVTGMSQKQIEKVLQETLAEAKETEKLEKEFYGKLGISQLLFDITQQEAKGLSPDLNLNFEFLLPSIQTMEQFGIRNVEGRQDIELAERLGIRIIYY